MEVIDTRDVNYNADEYLGKGVHLQGRYEDQNLCAFGRRLGASTTIVVVLFIPPDHPASSPDLHVLVTLKAASQKHQSRSAKNVVGILAGAFAVLFILFKTALFKPKSAECLSNQGVSEGSIARALSALEDLAVLSPVVAVGVTKTVTETQMVVEMPTAAANDGQAGEQSPFVLIDALERIQYWQWEEAWQIKDWSENQAEQFLYRTGLEQRSSQHQGEESLKSK
ncbi:hypothetical protein BKA70DRAFT_1234307 [Coprinopsis sp. MPI-PUGE-AT-0042]|nr:hypothetical protein BKA70DRAFT_1234307 [Coprinopsis sp. MPI-PUGE-AT-0042]